VFPCNFVDIAREDVSNTNHTIETSRREETQRRSAVIAIGRFDVFDLGPEGASRTHKALIGTVVEALVAAPAYVENEPHTGSTTPHGHGARRVEGVATALGQPKTREREGRQKPPSSTVGELQHRIQRVYTDFSEATTESVLWRGARSTVLRARAID
jgi:hypothetical protein